MHGEQRVGRVRVAQVLQLGGEAPQVVRERGGLGEVRRLDLSTHRDRRRARGALLHVTPEVGLNVHDDLLSICAGLLHEQLEVGVVGVHGRGVVEVAEVAVGFARAGAGIGLQQLVVREHGDVARGRSGAVVHEIGGELAGRQRQVLPRLPPLAGVDARREVLVAILPGHAAGGHPAGVEVGEPELQTIGRQRRRRGPSRLRRRCLHRRRASNEEHHREGKCQRTFQGRK